MAKEVKIVTFINQREGREDGEAELTKLVNAGYEIITAGGGTGADMMWGFVVLQREVPYDPRIPRDESAIDDGA